MSTIPETKLADYRIVREAGRGAMSTVYEAVDERTDRTVALKVLLAPASLPPEQQRSLIARLGREARLIARLSHPNIVRILDVGEAEGRHYLAMEYLQGTTLRERLDVGPMPLAEASLVVDQVAAALDAIHPQRIVHRDIKPSNVMLLPDGHVKLMDFGVARQGDDTTITQTGMIVGSPAYMSPEQIRGEDGTPASDLWALGVLLYEMLTGKSPFPGTNITAVLYKVTHDAPAPMTGVPPAVQQVIRRALEKKPGRRYRTAREFADALRATFIRLPAPRHPFERASPLRLPDGWPRIVLPTAGFLAVIASLLFLVLGSGHHSASTRYSMSVPSPIIQSLPVPTPPVTAAPAAIRKQPSHLSRKPALKILPPRKASHKLKAHRLLSHVQQAWNNHLRRLAARRSAHLRRLAARQNTHRPRFHPVSQYLRHARRSQRPYGRIRATIRHTDRDQETTQLAYPAHPVYGDSSPAD